MRNQTIFVKGFAILALILITPIFAGAQAGVGEDDTIVELPGIIELKKTVHFLAPTGTPVMIAPGEYEIATIEGALRLTPNDESSASQILIAAEPITHEKPLEDPEPLSFPGDEDQHVVILFLPNGKALQAVGSYSGVRTRGVKLNRGFWKGLVIPTISKVGAVRPGRSLTILGANFGIRGRVKLYLANPQSKTFHLRIEKWGSRKIRAEIPDNMSGFFDHQAKIQVFNFKGVGGIARKVPFYAVRENIVLSQRHPAVQVQHCSNSGNDNYCNGQRTNNGQSCPVTFTNRVKEATIYVRHVNCDILGKDKGTDRFSISLKNGWVFKRLVPFQYKNLENAVTPENRIALTLMSGRAEKYLGTSDWSPTIPWKVGPAPGQIELGYKVTIQGPRGIPFH